jgi:SET domain
MGPSPHQSSSSKEKESKVRSLLRGSSIASDCGTSNYQRLIHSPQTWSFLQASYKKIVDQNMEQIASEKLDRRELRYGQNEAEVQATNSYECTSGINIYAEVKEGPRGRGVFVTQEPVPKGTQAWRIAGPFSFATFQRPEEMIAFLELLPHDLQCDVLLWAYPTDNKAHVDLDEGSFINHAEDPDLVNLDSQARAVRPISPGEELLMDYSEFIDELDWFDDLRAFAWNDGNTEERMVDAVIDVGDEKTDDYSAQTDAHTWFYTQVGAPRTSRIVGGAGAGRGTLDTPGDCIKLDFGSADGNIGKSKNETRQVQMSLFFLSLAGYAVIVALRRASRLFVVGKH